jgi:hypothetical protein
MKVIHGYNAGVSVDKGRYVVEQSIAGMKRY